MKATLNSDTTSTLERAARLEAVFAQSPFGFVVFDASHHVTDISDAFTQPAGDAIPVFARIMAVADVYDALISNRVYKTGMPHAKAVEIIRAGRGTHFDPDICDCFLQIEAQFAGIATRFNDAAGTH